MLRKASLSLGYANAGKIVVLDTLVEEMTRVVRLYIDELWERQDFRSTFVDFKVDTWLSARLQQCLGKQALETVKSQRKRKKRTKPYFKGAAFNLDSRFVDFQYGNNSFDIWVRLSSLGRRLQLRLPAKAHAHYNKYRDWSKSKSVRLLKRRGTYFLEVFFEKQAPDVKPVGVTVGVDCGYKQLLVSSDARVYDVGLEQCYEKIARKIQGSKAFKRALIERDNLINCSLNAMPLGEVREVVCENLKNLKKETRGRLNKKFVNKLQRWSYAKVLTKLQYMTEEAGVLLTRVNPAYTSQRCCYCGVLCGANRRGKSYACACGNEMDADVNAAINLSHMGVYSPHA